MDEQSESLCEFPDAYDVFHYPEVHQLYLVDWKYSMALNAEFLYRFPHEPFPEYFRLGITEIDWQIEASSNIRW